MTNEKWLIDANALIDKVDESKHYNPHSQGRVRVNHRNEHDHFLRMIMDAPIVEAVEVVHGRWEDGYAVDCYGNIAYKSIDCSACHEIFKIETHNREYWKARFKVCPFCGALMDEEVRP